MVDVPDKYSDTPLHIAAKEGRAGIVNLLLEVSPTIADLGSNRATSH